MTTQQSHTYRIYTSNHSYRKCGKRVLAPTREEMRSIREHLKKQTKSEQFQNFSSPAFRKKLKHAITQPTTDRQKSKWITTRKTQSDRDFQTRWTRTPAANMRSCCTTTS